MIEMTIHHDGLDWIAENDSLSAKGRTLEDLDQTVGTLLRDRPDLKQGDKVRVFMAFQNATIPQWIRQYAQHYFNRIVEIEI